MNIFKNNYIKLLDENERASCKLESTTAYDIRCIMDYFRGCGIPLFEMEVIKKDILGLAKEADLEHVTLEEKLGMPLQEFCENMKREGSSSNWFGHLLKALQSACFIYTLICTFDFLLFYMWNPENYWIGSSDILFLLLLLVFNRGIDYLLDRMTFSPNPLKQKFLLGIRTLAWGFYLIIWPFISVYCNIPDIVLITGNAWIIELSLILITFLLWIGNNYYWNKQSEKYNWK